MPEVSITVFCSSSRHAPQVYLDTARELGAAIAAAGCTLVYGGNYCGCMAALADGARSRGGRVIGISPRVFVDKGLADTQCDELIVTDDLHRRKGLLEEAGDAFIVLPGGIGTFDELIDVLVGRVIGRHGKSIVLLNLDGFFAPFIGMLEHGVKLGFIKAGVMGQFQVVDSVKEAVKSAALTECAGEQSGKPR
jgi:uncharacterized protein (TIGR00730 family)